MSLNDSIFTSLTLSLLDYFKLEYLLKRVLA